MFNSEVVEFSINGIKMIGNCYNGSLIGLSNEGVELVNYIKEINKIPSYEKLTNEQKILLEALQKQGYFQEEQIGTKAAYVHVNNDCNLHCLGCYSHNSERNKNQKLTYEELCQALYKLRMLGVETIIISGGEPFLRPDIYKVFQYIKSELHFPGLQVITNGTQTDAYDYQNIEKYVDELNISIDGYDKNHPTFIRDEGIFEKVLNNAKCLKNANVNVKLIATLHKKNIDMAGEYVKLAEEIKIPLNFSMLTCSGDFDNFEEWIPTHEQLEKYGYGKISGIDRIYSQAKGTDFIVTARKTCGMGRRLISLDSMGNIYPCHMLHTSEVVLGNILTDSLDKIRASCDTFVKKICVEEIPSCSTCEYMYVCGGGCRARAFTMHNRITSEDDYCVLDKSYFKTVFNQLKKDIK